MLQNMNPTYFYNYTGGFTSQTDFHDQINNDFYSSDEFRMYSFKIKRCPRSRSHDWTECPFAHRGEKAQRRDPQKFNYAAIVCPAFRNGKCLKGDLCEFAHGVFEYWLHPARYRTRACNAGICCQRKVCFFAHTPEQLRPETRYKFQLAYRARIGGYENSVVIDEVNSANSVNSSNSIPTPEVWTEDSVNRVSEFLNSLRRLKIREIDDETERNLPDLDWIWELVE